MRTRHLLIALAALAALLPGPARADSERWRDGPDGRGPLALAGIETGHNSYGDPHITIEFAHPISPASFGRNDFVVLQLEGVGLRNPDFSYYFGARNGRWWTFGYNERTNTVTHGTHYFRTPGARKLRVRLWGEPWYPETGGHRFRVLTFSSSGRDRLPNRGWLVHDYTAPVVYKWQLPDFVLSTGEAPEIPVTWRVTDEGLSGIHDVTLWRRADRDAEWEPVESTKSTRRQHRRLPADQGAHLWFKVTASDNSGNGTSSHVLETRVPFDDSSTEQAAAYFGLWEEEEHVDAYLGGLHVSTTSLDTFSFTAEGRIYCIVYRTGPDYGQGVLEIDGEEHSMYMNSGITRLVPYCVDAESRATRDVVLRVQEGAVNVDGFWAG